MIDVPKFIDFICLKGMSANQYVICDLIYRNDTQSLRKYLATVGPFKKEDFDYLLEKKFLILSPAATEMTKYNIENLIVTEKFSKLIFRFGQQAAEEFFNAYPGFMYINGTYVSARNCDKEEVIEIYSKVVKGSPEKHQYIMEAVALYKTLVNQGDMNMMGIEKFLKGENWDIVHQINSEINGGGSQEEVYDATKID